MQFRNNCTQCSSSHDLNAIHASISSPHPYRGWQKFEFYMLHELSSTGKRLTGGLDLGTHNLKEISFWKTMYRDLQKKVCKYC